MNRRGRGAAAAALVLVALVSIAGLAAVAADTAAAQQAGQSPGPFTLEDLRSDGVQPSEAPDSVRYLGGESATGAVALRYRPADPLSNSLTYISPDATINTDQLQIYSTIFGGGTGDYEFVVAYWSEETRDVNGTSVPIAAEQEVQRVGVTLGSGYDTVPIKLQSHYNEEVQATAWLERNGERVEGARWRFSHASLPSSQQVQIATRADAWWYAAKTAIIPGVAGIVGGLWAARETLERTGRGPGLGGFAWGFLGFIGVLVALSALFYEIASVIAHLNILMGLSLAVVAYGGGLQMADETEKVAFERKELRDAKTLRGGGR